jgi:streptomycin 6-kinase
MDFPREFIESVHRVFGDQGRAWLPRLPGLIADCREKWSLDDGVMCSVARMNYIELTTTEAGDPVVLKIGVPNPELFTEMEALRLYGGRRAVTLLGSDAELGAILMRRLQPGTMLWQLGDNREETRIAASIMRELCVPVPPSHGLPTFAGWVERAFRLTRTQWDPEGLMPRDLIDRAEAAFEEILHSSNGDVVLHGDLHHENILLDSESGWTAIDPKGVVGPHCLEVGRFLQNQLPSTVSRRRREDLVRERVDVFGLELGIPRKTLVASGLVDCVMGHCWGFEEEDGIGPEWYRGLELARIYCEML